MDFIRVTLITLFFLLGLQGAVFCQSDSQINTAIPPTPSADLLKLAQVKSYQLSDKILLKVNRDGLTSPRKISVCENPFFVTLFMKSNIEGVTALKVLVETASLKEQEFLFALSNEGGLTHPTMIQSISVNLDKQAKYIDMNIWAFYVTKNNNVYANFLQAQCRGD